MIRPFLVTIRGDVDKIKTLVENGVDCSIGDYDQRTVLLTIISSIFKFCSESAGLIDIAYCHAFWESK